MAGLGQAGSVPLQENISALTNALTPQAPTAPIFQEPASPSPVTPPITASTVQTPLTQQPAAAPAIPQASPVQTAAHHYTVEDLANAAVMLMGSGRQPDLLNLLAQFGVEALPELPKEQYGSFATALRGLGAQI